MVSRRFNRLCVKTGLYKWYVYPATSDGETPNHVHRVRVCYSPVNFVTLTNLDAVYLSDVYGLLNNAPAIELLSSVRELSLYYTLASDWDACIGLGRLHRIGTLASDWDARIGLERSQLHTTRNRRLRELSRNRPHLVESNVATHTTTRQCTRRNRHDTVEINAPALLESVFHLSITAAGVGTRHVCNR